MTEDQVRKWFEKDLKNYDDPFWCYHSDLRNMLNNILERINGNARGEFEIRSK